MGCWSKENATKAYLRALKMAKRGKEPDIAEFISALAAGNSLQFMVMACAGVVASSPALALVAAAHQTGGSVMCILSAVDHFHASKTALGLYSDCVHFVVGEAKTLLKSDYKRADFVLIDCNIKDHREVFRAAQDSVGLIVGYNALHKGPWFSDQFSTHFLPIGEGLVVARVGATGKVYGSSGGGKRSRWVAKVDKFTGEEHVFRVTSPQRKEIKAQGNFNFNEGFLFV